MVIRKVLKLATLITASIGVLSTGAATGILAMNSSSDSQLFAANTRHYKGEWYNEGALVYEGYFTRGQNVEYQGPAPSKVDYTGEKIYVFTGWDTNGDNKPDVPVFKAYSNFKANATYLSINASILEKIDWQKLLEILMDKNIDLEALLARLGLSPEDIARLLGLNVLTVTSDVTGPAYLRTESFKDYNKAQHNWTDANYYSLDNISEGSVNPLQYTANKLSKLKDNPLIASYCQEATYQIKYNKTGGKYPVIAFESQNNQYIPSDSYSLTQPDEERSYTSIGFSLIPCTEETVIAGLVTDYTNDSIKNDERIYRDYARKEYLSVPEDYQSYFVNLANSIGASKNNVGQAVTAFTQYLTEYFTLDYKHNEFPKTSDPLLYFMNEAKVADSNYFATAMTLFLRSLGYPARYTQGYMGAITEPGVECPVTALQAYSWCEVYVDGIGWMNADGAQYLLVKLFNEYYELPPEVLELMDFSKKGNEKALDHIYAGSNTKFDYIGGTEFNKEDLELIAVYTDGTEEIVEPSHMTVPDISDYQNYYDRQVMALYEYLSDVKSLVYTIHVSPTRIEHLNVFNDEHYTVVSTIHPEDFYFTGDYDNGQTYDVDSSRVEFVIPEITDPGDYPVDFTFTQYYSDDPNDYVTVTTTYTLHIDPEPQILSIEPTFELQHLFYTDEEISFDREAWLSFRDNGEITQITITDACILNPELLSTHAPGIYTLQIQPSETCEVYEYTYEIIENVLIDTSVFVNSFVFYRTANEPYVLKPGDISCIAYYLRGDHIKDVSFEELEFSQSSFNEAGTYEVDVTYREVFEYSGEISITKTVEIYIDDNNVVSIDAQLMNDINIYKGDEITTDLFSSVYFIVTRKNGDNFIVDYDDPNITYDYSGVDRFTTGSNEVGVSLYCDDFGNTVSTSFNMNVIGIKSFEGNFSGIPEKVLTDTEYTIEDFIAWDIYGVVTYFNGDDYENTEYIYPEDPRLTINFESPFIEPDSYALTLIFNDGREEVSDSTLVNVIKYGVKDVQFDLSSLADSYYYSDNIDFSGVYAVVTYYDDTEEVIEFNSGLIDVDNSHSLGGTPEDVEFIFTIHMDNKDFTESKIITIIKPESIYFDEAYALSKFNVTDNINIYNMPVYLRKDDGSEERIGDSSLVTLSLQDPIVPGLNVLSATFYDGKYTLEDTIEVIIYEKQLSVTLEDKEYFEGVPFDGSYTAEMTYNSGGYYIDEPINVTDEVDFEYYGDPLKAGENTFTFSYYDSISGNAYYDYPTVAAYSLVDVKFDFSEFNTEYLRLDEIDDISKIKVTGVYDNGVSTIELPLDSGYCEVEDLETNNLGKDKTASVAYVADAGRFIDYFFYDVIEPKVVNIELISDDCTLFTYEGIDATIIDISNLRYHVTYENGASEEFYYDEHVDNAEFTVVTPVYIDKDTAVGKYDFIFSYTHYSAEAAEVFSPLNLEVEVKENKVERIDYNNYSVKTTYFVGESFEPEDYQNLIVVAFTSAYKDYPDYGSYQLNSEEYTVTLESFELGKNTVTISYNKDPSITASYQITLKEDEPSHYNPYNYPISVKEGEPIDLSEIKMTIYYESGKTEDVPTSDLEIKNPPTSDTPGVKYFDVYYHDEKVSTCSVEVLENKDILQYIYLNKYEIKVEQGDSESYNSKLNSIQVHGYFQESGERLLDPSEYTITGNVNLNKIGTYTLTVTPNGYKDLAREIIVSVTEPLKITGIEILDSYTFTLNQDYDPETFLNDIRIEVSFNLQDSIVITLSDPMVTYYYLNGPNPSTDVVTKEPKSVEVCVGIYYNNVYYEDDTEFSSTLYYEVVRN